MGELYVPLKWLHVLSATVLFGTGIGTAFHFWRALRGSDARAIAASARTTVLADFVFTLPAAVVQPVSGVALAWIAGYPLHSTWIVASAALYLLAGGCWVPVVFIQLRMRRLAEHASQAGTPLDAEFKTLARRWFLLGWPAFLSLIAILWLMVARPT